MENKLAKHYLWGGIAWFGVSATVTIIDTYLLGFENLNRAVAFGIFLIWILPTLWMWRKAEKLANEVN